MMKFDSSALRKESLARLAKDVAKAWLPPSDIGPVEYAMENVRIVSGPRPGRFIPDPYVVEIMNTISDPRIFQVDILKSVQSGLTQAMECLQYWDMDIHGRQIAVSFGSQEAAARHAKDRMRKAINQNHSLRKKLIVATNRSSGTTIREFRFKNGGLIYLPSAATVKEMKSYSVQHMFQDELSSYEATKEGDPSAILKGRLEQWEDGKLYRFSTPAKPKGEDPIEQGYLASSMAKWHVPCPKCNKMQWLRFRDPNRGDYRLIFEKDSRGRAIKESVHYVCEACNHKISQQERVPMIHAGQWVHEHPDLWEHRGYLINGLMPTVRHDQWYHIVKEFLGSQSSIHALKTFVNNHLAETFEENHRTIGAEALKARLEDYPDGIVPARTAVLIADVDVQKDRLEVNVWAFGPNQEMWLVDIQVFVGEPIHREVWGLLDEYLLTPMPHELTKEPIYIDICGIDTGYPEAIDAVYDFIAPRQGGEGSKREVCPVYGIKGRDVLSKKNVYAQRGYAKDDNIKLYILAKDMIMIEAINRLIEEQRELEEVITAWGEVAARPVEGQDMSFYVHLPIWMTDEQVKQLAAVKYRTEIDKKTGEEKVVWGERKRNEVWDLYCYAFGMLYILQTYLSDRFTDLEAAMIEKQKVRTKPKAAKRQHSIISDISDYEIKR
jgi:phage terminase large subunit GpA-like protein